MSLVVDVQHEPRKVAVNFELADQEHLAIIGPNGAGKSTILALVSGILAPTSGQIRLDDRILANGTRRAAWVPPHDRRIGLLAQEPLLFPHLTAVDNVAFGLRSGGYSRTQSKRIAMAVLKRVGMSDVAERRPRQLSGGQAQRVAIARALAPKPHLLLLDEPLAALDAQAAPAIRQLLAEIVDCPLIVVTHDVLDAVLLSDRLLVMEDGAAAQMGPTSEVLAAPRSGFAAQFADLNIVSGPLRGNAVEWRDTTLEGVRVEEQVCATSGFATFHPSTVSVHMQRPGGSQRNVLPVRIDSLHQRGGLVRVNAGGLMADITPQSVAELALAPGREVFFAIKASQVRMYGS